MNRPTQIIFSLSLLTSAALAEGGFYGDPPDATHPWAIHDMNRPQPVRVEPGTFSSQEVPGIPPSDAVILFGGKAEDIEKWMSDKKDGEPTKWEVKDGVLQCVPGSGYIRTKEEFSDCQLHIEWSAPGKVEGNSQGRGNSGVFLLGRYEIQVLDSYENRTYADGQAASLYGQRPPLVNACRGPGQWQTYDIVFEAPRFDGEQLTRPARVTVFHNGVLVHHAVEFLGPTRHRQVASYEPHESRGPIALQDHGNPVRYRNIWVRRLGDD